MKKSLVLLTAAAMFAACAEKDVLIDNLVEATESPIGFTTDMNYMTRAENSSATAKYALETYNKSFLVWGNKNVTEEPKNPKVFEKQLVEYSTSWDYTPHRFWDKSAIFYRFYAVSPADNNWVASPTSIDNVTTPLKFSYTGYVADGLSLDQMSATTPATRPTQSEIGVPTIQPNEVFTEGKDLMISDDITDWNPANTTVNLNFNHILSRLNIAVKSSVQQTYNKKNKQIYLGEDTEPLYTVYTSSLTGETEYIYVDGGYYTYSGSEGSYTKAETPYDNSGADMSVVKIDDPDSPASGVVKLTALKVFNMYKEGDFNEMGYNNERSAVLEEAIEATKLAAGTDLRWKASNPNTSGFGVTFSSSVANSDEYVKTDNVSGFTDVVKNDEYKFFYQGLVVPQTVSYESVDIKGPSVLSDAKPYLKISFTIDGEPFTYYYNLARVFSNVDAQYVVNGRKAWYDETSEISSIIYEGDGNKFYATYATTDLAELTVAYKKGENYYSALTCLDTEKLYIGTSGKYYTSEEAASTDDEATGLYTFDRVLLVVASNTSNALKPVTRGEAAVAGIAPNECDITFCEGWQNNLFIDINPVYILFSADVYEWVKKAEYEFVVKE